MTAEPRTLRTKAEEALAAEYAERARPPARRRARPGARRDAAFSLFERLRPAASPGRGVEIHRPPRADPDGRAACRRRRAADAAGGDRRRRSASPGSTGRRSWWSTASTEPELSDLAGLEGVDGRVARRRACRRARSRRPAVRRRRRYGDGAEHRPDAGRRRGDGRRRRQAGAADRDRPPDRRPRRRRRRRPATSSRSAPTPRSASSRAIAGRPASAYQVNTLTELDIGRGARVLWSRVQTESEAAQHLASFVARMADDTTLDHLSVNRGAALARWQGFVTDRRPRRAGRLLRRDDAVGHRARRHHAGRSPYRAGLGQQRAVQERRRRQGDRAPSRA